jgi:hypothetical protein
MGVVRIQAIVTPRDCRYRDDRTLSPAPQ